VRGRFATILVGLSISSSAIAGKHPRFEPTDLELESSGTVQLDLQAGPVRGPDANRVVAADFEIDVGILPNLPGFLMTVAPTSARFFPESLHGLFEWTYRFAWIVGFALSIAAVGPASCRSDRLEACPSLAAAKAAQSKTRGPSGARLVVSYQLSRWPS
jgi:hypothetical protein